MLLSLTYSSSIKRRFTLYRFGLALSNAPSQRKICYNLTLVNIINDYL